MQRKRWTREEMTFLEENVGRFKLTTIAKKLNRTIYAVESKVLRMGLGETKIATGMYTQNQLSIYLGVDSHVVARWINNHGLKATKKATRTSTVFIFIKAKDFWNWAYENKEKINFSKIEPKLIIPEPDWVEGERKKDFYTIPKRKLKKWTDEEEKILISMLNNGCSKEEIGLRLKRSTHAIQRKISKLRSALIIPMEKVVIPWKDEEVELLLKFEAEGLGTAEIAKELGRSVHQIRWKRGHLRREGVYKNRRKQTVAK